ncbi:hypothetical protein COLO4_11992 [Corchorus olitorius]|uniref:Uncharacterized protein n=1 Tax=Corchorus olitorius TaxID=93759 RepID=A0A1R3K2F9_9ROSI|nr:hypothetical protein COLO4_11992 [Corchorus olitorius]
MPPPPHRTSSQNMQEVIPSQIMGLTRSARLC